MATKSTQDLSAADSNRTIDMWLTRELRRLLRRIGAPGFRGGFSIRVNAINGRVQPPEVAVHRTGLYPEEETMGEMSATEQYALDGNPKKNIT